MFAFLWIRLVALTKRRIRYSWQAAIIQGVAILGCQLLWLCESPPGVSIACLAMAAVVISFRIDARDFARLERVVWIILSAAFLYTEINSIAADRAESNARAADERSKFQALIEQGRAINSTQQGQQGEFSALLKQGDTSIKNLSGVARQVSSAVSYTSGGDSFPEIFPNPISGAGGKPLMSFALHKIGEFPLFDLKIIVGRPYQVAKENNQRQIFGATCSFPEINGQFNIPLLTASLGDEDAAYFTADMWARNARWEEVIDVRRVDGGFASHLVVYQEANDFSAKPKKIAELSMGDFPEKERHEVLCPSQNLSLPNISKQPSAPQMTIERPNECGGKLW